jgi:hypothetical protein
MGKHKEKKNKPGMIGQLLEETLKENPELSQPDIYRAMEMSKQNFFGQTLPTCEVTPKHWPRWRKGLGISKLKFWKFAQDFYDPD